MGLATHLRQGYGAPSIEGKVARVATSKLGNERVSITNPAPNPRIILGRCFQGELLAIGTDAWVLRSGVVAAVSAAESCVRKSGENSRSQIQHPRAPRCPARTRLGTAAQLSPRGSTGSSAKAKALTRLWSE